MIRRATRGDAGKVSLLAEKTFRDTFGPLNTGEDIDSHCRTSYSEAIQAAEIDAANMITLVSEIDGRLAGFAQLRWGEAAIFVVAQSPGEIQRFYIAADWHGKGLAGKLMHACIEEMKARGSDVVWLGVWEKNARAIAFYQKFGFIEVGDHIFRVGSDPQRDIVMARSVADSGTASDTR